MKTLGLAALLLSLSACVSPPRKSALTGTYKENKVSVLTFNVENLFDLEDDPGKNDEAFLPAEKKTSELVKNRCYVQNQSYRDSKKSKEERGKIVELEREEDGMQEFFTQMRVNDCLHKDWSRQVLDRKMARLTDVLRQVNNGYGPDLLILQEVENERVLREWRDRFLADMNYENLILIEGPDERGIDTAILSRLPQYEPPKLHAIDFSKFPEIDANDRRPTRGLLEARLRLPNGEKLAVFSVHFPSQGASSDHRRAAALALLEATAKVPPDVKVLVGGDFNITSREEWKKRYFRDLLGKEFGVSFLMGLDDEPGSTYFKYDHTWSYFDVLLFSKSLLDGRSRWVVDNKSIRLVRSSVYQTDSDGKPAKFHSGYSSVGVSDHWPVYAELVMRPTPRLEAYE